MQCKLIDNFCWIDIDGGQINFNGGQNDELVASDIYKELIGWAGKARGQNPNAFDALTEWILDDAQWGEANLAANEKILMNDCFARFKEQNSLLRARLTALRPSGVVNEAVFKALDRFDEELSGNPADERLRKAVAQVFTDFSAMGECGIRKLIAGSKTGPEGVNSVEIFGYINYLKDCDAGVQWALFMPEAVAAQQKGFKVASFEYKKMPAMRFIGREDGDLDIDIDNMDVRKKLFETLEAMRDYKSGFDYDVLFMHHYGLGVDVGPWHGFWGRFMKAGAPVPEGFCSFDFVPQRDGGNFTAGEPFLSQFAYAIFEGDMDAIHGREGYDSDAMYDITRNTMLGQGVNIPYPEKYWTAEVFLDGCDKYSSAYMFNAEL